MVIIVYIYIYIYIYIYPINNLFISHKICLNHFISHDQNNMNREKINLPNKQNFVDIAISRKP